MKKVKAIRWISFDWNPNTGPESPDSLPDDLGKLLWEKNPTREVSVEILPVRCKNTFCFHYGAIGLEVDTTQSILVRVYAEDGCTIVNEKGELRPADEEQESEFGTFWSTGWENAHDIWYQIPRKERTAWAEGIVKNPVYKTVIVREDDDFFDPDQLELIQQVFDLPVQYIKTQRNAGRDA